MVEKGFRPGTIRWVHLECDEGTLLARARHRSHFMPPSLLKSQLETLEPPSAGNCVILDAKLPVPDLVEALRTRFCPQKGCGSAHEKYWYIKSFGGPPGERERGEMKIDQTRPDEIDQK